MCGILAADGSIPYHRLNFATIKHRGPDNSRVAGGIGFHRLAIQDPRDDGNQPFYFDGVWLACNGEIYNYDELTEKWLPDHNFQSGSDCEILAPLLLKLGIEGLVNALDAEFALVANFNGKWVAARDPIGIRPLFYGFHTEGKVAFASEAKALINWCDEVKPFPPGHYYNNGMFVKYSSDIASYAPQMTLDQAVRGIEHNLVSAVRKRLRSDVPTGYLLSGGLDSSIICAIAARSSEEPINTFAIGIETNPIDTKYAKIVADHIGSNHHEVLFSENDVLEALDKIIYHLETWDITTIRASVGMYLVCKYIWETTDIKVIMTGEVSDELFGYKYTDFAPTPKAFQEEAIKRVEELYMYDVLRADRCISAWGLEARVPFADKQFVRHVMSIPSELKLNTTKMGKHLLRLAFDNSRGIDWLPDEILFREKAAFSDAVGHRMVDYLKEIAEEKYDKEELLKGRAKWTDGGFFTKEALMYREIFERHFPGRGYLIKDFWMPNRSWEGCHDVSDPSARALSNYGSSGQ